MKEVPKTGNYHEVWSATEANELESSQEWRVEQVTDKGKYVLRRIKQ